MKGFDGATARTVGLSHWPSLIKKTEPDKQAGYLARTILPNLANACDLKRRGRRSVVLLPVRPMIEGINIQMGVTQAEEIKPAKVFSHPLPWPEL
jgi:hypothetical protein